MRKHITLFTLCLMVFGTSAIEAQVTVTSQVSSMNDDAEEQGSNGSSPGTMDLSSSDLELVIDGNDGNQYVGMRFTNLAVPQGAYITQAYIQFTVDETDSDSTAVSLQVEEVDDATAFGSAGYNISNRSLANESVLWEDIPAWSTVGQAGADQRTPDLAALVQTIVDRSGWSSGNAINFIVTGIGSRTAESYDGSASDAPVLVVEYMVPSQVSIQVGSSSDDAEEQGPNGSSPGTMDLTSSDLELVVDGNDGNQHVGIRFDGVDVPAGSFITHAYIQFTVDETDSDTTSVWFKVEDAANGTTFASSSNNISNRDITGDSVLWEDIPAWSTVGQSNDDQRTPNLASLVQGIVDQGGWSSGNAINFITTGIGSRTAESYDGSSADAPVLIISYLSTSAATYQVTSSSDDAEEQGSNGSSPGTMDLTSSDLELVQDGNDGDQWVGMRFNSIAVPQGALIASAYIQFTVDENDTLTGDKFIWAEDVDNSATFVSTSSNISTRDLTAASVVWTNIPNWPTVGAAGPDQRTPNLAAVVQEVVNRSGWASGNSLNILMHGSGERVAESYDGSSSDAPQLILTYVPGTAPLGEFPVDSGTVWAYHDSGFALPSTWIDTNFNDSSWAFGPAQLGYGDGDEATVIDYGSNANDKYPTYYFRQRFEAENVSQWDSLRYYLKYDDGAIVYLNGQEVFRVNLPTGTVGYDTLAQSAISGSQENQFTQFIGANDLIEGINTVAVEVHQNAPSSSDVTFDFRLEGTLPPAPIDTFPLADGGIWYYLDNGSDQDTVWRQFAFDPYSEGWDYGDAQFGYGDGDETTVVSYGSNGSDKYITTYFYKEFYLDTTGTGAGDSLLLGLLRDDGAAVYVNGQLVVLDNLPTTYDYTTWSTTIVSGADESTFFQHKVPTSAFNNGLNSIAVEIHQRDGTSSDKSFDFYLDIVPAPPVAGSGCTGGVLNHIGCFISIDDMGQSQFLTIPESHAFQVIFQQGEAYDNFSGVAPGNNDFTGYVPLSGSSTQGYVDVNHETSPGGVSVLDVHYDAANRLWVTDSINRVDMYNNSLQTTQRNCSGGVTPWGTSITSEETYNGGDNNNDGYTDLGWNVEIDPATRQVVGQTKLWALGRMSHENVVVANDSITVYQGEDGGSSCVFKFIADNPADLSSGTLYVLKMDNSLSGGEPTGTTGQWIVVPNTTQSDRNNTRSLATTLGGTWFNGVEDCEISPVDGKIYFTSKGFNRIYSFTDNGTTVGDFETFVGGTSYAIHIGSSIINVPWGSGNDNLAFDDLGNLWVNQDGGNDYIWMVRPNHTQSSPKVELFGSTPNASEPTGVTFTPDSKFMFMSIQHPSGSNGSFQDASGNTYAFDRSSTLVVARKEYLGMWSPETPATSLSVENPENCETVELDWTSGNGAQRLVIAKEGSAVDQFPVDGVAYTADATFGNGDDLGGGNYVIYDGTGSGMQALGLDDQNEYHFAVVEYTPQYGSYFYNNTAPALNSFEFDAPVTETITGVDSSLIGEWEVYDVGGTSGYSYDWSVTGGNILTGQTTPAITVEWTAFGTQTVQVDRTTEQGCDAGAVDYSVEVGDTLTGIDSYSGKVGYNIYPNPTSSITTIQFSGKTGADITMYDANGARINMVFKRSADQVTFDVDALPAGVYFIQMDYPRGESSTYELIVE